MIQNNDLGVSQRSKTSHKFLAFSHLCVSNQACIGEAVASVIARRQPSASRPLLRTRFWVRRHLCSLRASSALRPKANILVPEAEVLGPPSRTIRLDNAL